jgi:N-acyl-D-amino-acid deacylase
MLERIEAARAGGLNVFCDRYPYVASATGLDMYFPLWAREGTTDVFLARLRDPGIEETLRAHVRTKEEEMGSWDRVLISGVHAEANKELEGKDILGPQDAGKPVYEFIRDLLEEERDVSASSVRDSEITSRAHGPSAGRHGSDGQTSLRPAERKAPSAFYGAFPRAFGKYVREEKLLSIEAMVRKLTSVPAARFGFTGRGVLKPGNFADIVVFAPDKIRDKATWADPHQYPEGIPHVLVNGKLVVRDGEHTGALPGVALRKGGQKA